MDQLPDMKTDVKSENWAS